VSRKAAFLISLVSSSLVYADPIDVSCYWGPPSVPVSGGSAVAAKLYSKSSEPAYFRIDVGAGTVSNNDPNNIQNIVLPTLHLESDASTVRVVALGPNIKGLKEGGATIQVSIDRYTLESTMVLAVAPPGSKALVGEWARLGKCAQKRF